MANKLELLSKIDDTEAEILSDNRFIKYIFSGGDNGTSKLYISVGEDTPIQYIMQSVFAVINTVYAGIQKSPNGQKNAEVFRDNLKKSIKSIRSEQDRLMGIDRNRIEDSYVLAPLLRETTAHLTHSITLPPKDFNALILDKILPLKGDAMKVFDCLLGNLVEHFEDRKTAVDHFSDNLSIVMKCLSSELKSCPEPSIASAIANTCRTVEKLGTVQNINEQMVQRTADTFPRLF